MLNIKKYSLVLLVAFSTLQGSSSVTNRFDDKQAALGLTALSGTASFLSMFFWTLIGGQKGAILLGVPAAVFGQKILKECVLELEKRTPVRIQSDLNLINNKLARYVFTNSEQFFSAVVGGLMGYGLALLILDACNKRKSDTEAAKT